MSELEFEKACRGPAQPVPDEFAWGDTKNMKATGVTNPGQTYETPYPVGANIAASPGTSNTGPMRSGSFAMNMNTRLQSGASYYGIMELSGNLWEHCYPISNSTFRAFDGSHGDGYLEPSGTWIGDPTNTGWPNRHVHVHTGGFRGGSFKWYIEQSRVSDRYLSFYGGSDRTEQWGFRCVRTAP